MYIKDIFDTKKPVLSFEVFPPKKTENLEKVKSIVEEISKIPADYMSVTYGAGGSTSKLTAEIAQFMQDELGVGIKNILALRGDIPSGSEFPLKDGYSYASELTEAIKQYGGFCVGGACYPECHPDCDSLDKDIDNLKRKVDAGADFLVTQMFFNNEAFYDFRDKCVKKGIDVPITAGIMPLTNAKQIEKMCVLSGGASMPSGFVKIISKYIDNPTALKQAGIAYAINQIIDLVSNDTRGIHIYTMNNPETASQIVSAVNAMF